MHTTRGADFKHMTRETTEGPVALFLVLVYKGMNERKQDLEFAHVVTE